MQRMLRPIPTGPLPLGLHYVLNVRRQTSPRSYILHSTNQQVQLHAHNQLCRAGTTQPKEDRLMSEEELMVSIAAMTNYKETRDRLEQQMREQMPWLAQKIRDDMKKEQDQ